MTISSSTRKAGPFQGNGVTTVFPFTFKVFQASDIQVIKTSVQGTDAILTLNSDYSVALNGDQNNNPGGSITYPLSGSALASGEKLTAIGALPALQGTHITNGGAFFANNIEDQMDYLTILVQQLVEAQARVALASSSDSNPSLSVGTAAQRANKFLTFDTSGNVALATTLPSSTLSRATVGSFLYPQTVAEAAASVSVSDFSYAPLNPFRYGADGTGGAADATAVTRVNAVIAQIATGMAAWNNGLAVAGYDTTAAEVAAGATVKNPMYPPLHVKRYGAKGDGLTNDGPAFQAAINVAKAIGGFVTWDAPSVNYSIQQALDCTTTGQPNITSFGFKGAAGLSYDIPALMFKHTGHAFDCTGTRHIIFTDMTIGTDAVTYPKTCFMIARNNTNGSAGWHRFNNVRVQGKFSGTILYNYGSEDDVYIGCDWTNTASDVGARVAVWTSANRLAYTSTFQTISSGGQSCIDHQVFGGQFHMQSNSAQTDVFYIDGIDSLKVWGPWMYAGSISGGGRSLLFVDGTHGASNFIILNGITGENAGANTHANGILFSNDAVTYANWRIESCKLTSGTLAISSPVGPSFTNFKVSQIMEVSSHGITLQGSVANSTFDTDTTLLNFSSIPNTILIGDSSRWTLGSKDGGYLIDTGTTGRSWTPALGTVAHGGVLTVNEQRCIIEGNKVFLTCTISDTVSITATLGQTITGLPFAAKYRSAMVLVANQTTGAAIGAGFIDAGATAMKMPAFSVGAGVAVTITAEYFIAA